VKPPARYHLVWALVLLVTSGAVAVIAATQWLQQGRPPVYHFWAQQMIVVVGAYHAWYHTKAFNKERKS
jgi:hypothetical protein